MSNFIYALSASIIFSMVSFIGVITLLFNEKNIKIFSVFFAALSAGIIIGCVFFQLLPATVSKSLNFYVHFGYFILGGIFIFFIQKYISFVNRTKNLCEFYSFTYMNLVSKGIYNFINGLIIAVIFYVDINLGIWISIAVILRRISFELGDSYILIYKETNKFKAASLCFLSVFAAVIGTIAGYYCIEEFNKLIIISFLSGVGVYVVFCDSILKVKKKKSLINIVIFLIGVSIMLFI